ncbi:MAG: adenylyl-sulfate kinase [Fibrobacterota bacterium]|nr:adenylyl-sulfate kinase [Fibrobacterota bacterium]
MATSDQEKPTEDAKTKNVVWHKTSVNRDARIRISGQRSAVLWFTGLSGSGKSTLANALEIRLNQAGKLSYLLDGDNVRLGLCSDLGFSEAERKENNRRVAHVSRLLWDANIMTLVSFISPFRAERESSRKLIGADFLEIFVDTPLAVCETRDPKGLYAKARKGEIAQFTGISSPYEPPLNPEITLHTNKETAEDSLDRIMALLKERGYL